MNPIVEGLRRCFASADGVDLSPRSAHVSYEDFGQAPQQIEPEDKSDYEREGQCLVSSAKSELVGCSDNVPFRYAMFQSMSVCTRGPKRR